MDKGTLVAPKIQPAVIPRSQRVRPPVAPGVRAWTPTNPRPVIKPSLPKATAPLAKGSNVAGKPKPIKVNPDAGVSKVGNTQKFPDHPSNRLGGQHMGGHSDVGGK